MKLCIDCKHYLPDTPQMKMKWFLIPTQEKGCGELDKCAHPSLLSKVDGSAVKYADIQREFSHTECGREGRLWQGK